MRKEVIPSVVVCIIMAAAVSLTLSGDFHDSPLIAAVKIVGILGLIGLGATLALGKKKANL